MTACTNAVNYWRISCLLAATHVFGFTWPPPGRAQRRRVVGHWGCNPGIAWVIGHLSSHWKDQEPFLLVIGTGHATSFIFAHRALSETWSAKRITDGALRYGQPGGDPSEIIGLPNVPYQGGELGAGLAVSQSLAAYGKRSLTVCVIGDGECEVPTTLAAFVHADLILKGFEKPFKAGWLPVINANGARMGSRALWNSARLELFLSSLGYQVLRSGNNPDEASKSAATALTKSLAGEKVVWISETEKGWPAPSFLAGQSFRLHHAHKPTGIDPIYSELEFQKWLNSLHDYAFIDNNGNFHSDIVNMARRASLECPPIHLRDTISVPTVKLQSGEPPWESPMKHIDNLLAKRETLVFSPDEALSNRMNACLAKGTVQEVLAEEVCAAWTWGAIEAGREAVFVTYEAFAPLASTCLAQYSKLIHSRPNPGRPPFVFILTSLGWANSPSHQNTDVVATILARPWPRMHLTFPIGAISSEFRTRDALNKLDSISVIVCSKQNLLDLPDPGGNVLDIRIKGGPPPTTTIVALGDVCVTEAVASMTAAATSGIGIRIVAVVDLTQMGTRAVAMPLPEQDSTVIGTAWCAPGLIAPAMWTAVGRSFQVFGYIERWGATPWETLRANGLDRISLLSRLSEKGLIPRKLLTSIICELGREGDSSFSGGVPTFACPKIEVTSLGEGFAL